MTSKLTNPIWPVVSLLLTASMWGIVWYPLRLLEERGLEGLWTSLISYGAALAVGISWLLVQKRQWPSHPFAFSIMILAVGWCNVAFVLAVLDGTIVRVLLLFYLSPLWALLLGWVILGEKPTLHNWGIFFLGVIGALVMLWDDSMGLPWPKDTADWLAVSSGFAFSMSNAMMRKVGHVHIGFKAVVSWLGVVIVAAVWILLSDAELPDVEMNTIYGAVLLGLLGFVVMTLTVIYGVTHMPVHRSAVILLFELVVGAISALLLTNEIVLMREWLGGALILLSAYLAAREQITQT